MVVLYKIMNKWLNGLMVALDPTEGDCKGLAASHIEKGHFTIGSNDGRNSNSNMIIIKLI
jgi:hypothetical protein